VTSTELDVTNKRFGIALYVRHPRLRLTEEMAAFPLSPRNHWDVNDARVAPNGTSLGGVRSDSLWSYWEILGGDEIAATLNNLVALLEQHEALIKRVTDGGGLVCLFVQLPGDIAVGDDLGPELLSRMARLNITLSIQSFPNFGGVSTEHRDLANLARY
jgi:hypothetical protein